MSLYILVSGPFARDVDVWGSLLVAVNICLAVKDPPKLSCLRVLWLLGLFHE